MLGLFIETFIMFKSSYGQKSKSSTSLKIKTILLGLRSRSRYFRKKTAPAPG